MAEEKEPSASTASWGAEVTVKRSEDYGQNRPPEKQHPLHKHQNAQSAQINPNASFSITK